MDENTSWQKQLTVGIGLLVVVGLLVGGVFALVALKAADVAGVGNKPAPTSGPPPGLGPTTSPPTTTPSTPSNAATPTGITTTLPPRQPRLIRLVATPTQGTTYQQITLSGRYRTAAEGTALQVQRNEGSWVDFPVTTTVSGGQFSTTVETGRVGPNQFRVLDTSTGRFSNIVLVRIS